MLSECRKKAEKPSPRMKNLGRLAPPQRWWTISGRPVCFCVCAAQCNALSCLLQMAYGNGFDCTSGKMQSKLSAVKKAREMIPQTQFFSRHKSLRPFMLRPESSLPTSGKLGWQLANSFWPPRAILVAALGGAEFLTAVLRRNRER